MGIQEAQVKNGFLSEIKVVENVKQWVPNKGNTCSKHTQYMQIVDLSWQINTNTLTRKVFVKRNEAQKEIILCIDAL